MQFDGETIWRLIGASRVVWDDARQMLSLKQRSPLSDDSVSPFMTLLELLGLVATSEALGREEHNELELGRPQWLRCLKQCNT